MMLSQVAQVPAVATAAVKVHRGRHQGPAHMPAGQLLRSPPLCRCASLFLRENDAHRSGALDTWHDGGPDAWHDPRWRSQPFLAQQRMPRPQAAEGKELRMLPRTKR